MLSPADAENSVREAMKMGCSLAETANAHVNERAVGRGYAGERIEVWEHQWLLFSLRLHSRWTGAGPATAPQLSARPLRAHL